MGSLNDYFANLQRLGTVGNPSALVPANSGSNSGLTTQNYYYRNDGVYDPNLDAAWGRSYNAQSNSGSDTSNTYYDYFYSGQDIIITVDGTEGDPAFKTLPIANFAFSVQQQKAPIYGFWSYTYDAVLRGTRLIQGQFTIATRYPNYMKDLIARAAQTREETSVRSYGYFKDLTEDDQNIEKYWGKNMDPSLNALGNSVYSVHPPFSFVITYGVQNVSVPGLDSRFEAFAGEDPWMLDTNERLMEADATHQYDRIILDACEIQSMETSFGSDGAVVGESYSFFARDIITP